MLENNLERHTFRHLLVSPFNTRRKLLALIEREIKFAKAKKPAHIRLKFNNLTDIRMIDKLYAASKAGVKIELIIRGICCLKPGVKGLSENITAISIVDRYLEHTRFFIFGTKRTTEFRSCGASTGFITRTLIWMQPPHFDFTSASTFCRVP
jgi:polyphosphate kinase